MWPEVRHALKSLSDCREDSCTFIPYMLSETEQNVQNQPMAKVLFISGKLPVDSDGPLLMEQQPIND